MGMRFVKSEDEVVYSTETNDELKDQHEMEEVRARQEEWDYQCSTLDWI